MPQNLPERYLLGRQGRGIWPNFFANLDFCFRTIDFNNKSRVPKDRLSLSTTIRMVARRQNITYAN